MSQFQRKPKPKTIPNGVPIEPVIVQERTDLTPMDENGNQLASRDIELIPLDHLTDLEVESYGIHNLRISSKAGDIKAAYAMGKMALEAHKTRITKQQLSGGAGGNSIIIDADVFIERLKSESEKANEIPQ